MRILILGFTKLAYMPYMNFYLKQLLKTDSEIHMFYWNRDGKAEIGIDERVILHEFCILQKDEVAKFEKIGSFLKYRKAVKKLINTISFDLVIMLHTLPGVLIYDILKKRFVGKYILDYRDVTFENNILFKRIIHGLVMNANATFVSSDAFRKYLPNIDRIYTSHNILFDSLEHRDVRRFASRNIQPIKIRYWGFIRHENINKAIIDRLGNDSRFELHYHGREQETAEVLKMYCERLKITNVYFHGEYKPKDRHIFSSETDLIHNVFDNDKVMQPAMSNKFYDGIIFYIPQLCNKGSFMGNKVAMYNIGLECDPHKNDFADELFSYFKSINWNEFEKNCDKLLYEVLVTFENGEKVICEMVKSLSLGG